MARILSKFPYHEVILRSFIGFSEQARKIQKTKSSSNVETGCPKALSHTSNRQEHKQAKSYCRSTQAQQTHSNIKHTTCVQALLRITEARQSVVLKCESTPTVPRHNGICYFHLGQTAHRLQSYTKHKYKHAPTRHCTLQLSRYKLAARHK